VFADTGPESYQSSSGSAAMRRISSGFWLYVRQIAAQKTKKNNTSANVPNQWTPSIDSNRYLYILWMFQCVRRDVPAIRLDTSGGYFIWWRFFLL